MNQKKLSLAASILATCCAWADPYEFTDGTDIPLSAEYSSCVDCSIQSDGYTIGSTHKGSTFTLSLANKSSGDYVLSMKGGAKSLSATYTLTVAYGSEYSRVFEATQENTGKWTTYNEVAFALDSLPAGNITLTLAITGTTGSYAGNYGYFRITSLSSCELEIPASADLTSPAYMTYSNCSCSGDSKPIGSVRNASSFSFAIYCPSSGWYRLSYKSGAKSEWGASSLAWTLRNASASSATNVCTQAIGGDGYAFHGGAALSNSHSVDFGILDAGLYVLTATASKDGGDYCANFGDFVFEKQAFHTIASGEVIPLGVSARGDAEDYVTLSNCSIDDPLQVVGSTHDGSAIAVALCNETEGDWTLSVLGGAKGLSATYDLSVTNAAGYAKTVSVTQADTSSWKPSQEATLALSDLPAGTMTLVLSITSTTDSTTDSYAGNYGYFTFTRIGAPVTVSVPTFWSESLESASSVTVEDGGYIVIDASGYAGWTDFSNSFSLANVTVPDGKTLSDVILVYTGANTTDEVSVDGTAVTVTVSETASNATTWTGLGSDAAWSTAANWTHGVPSSSFAASFVCDASVTMSAAKVAKFVLGGNDVSLSGSCTVNIAAFESGDSGTLSLSGITVKGEGGKSESDLRCLEIPAGIALDITGNSCISDAYGTIWVCGKVTVEEGAQLELEYAVDLLGGIAGAGSIYVADNKGVGSRTTDAKYGSRDAYTRYIDGDCSGFTGTYTEGGNSSRSVATCFRGMTNGSAGATWNLNGIKFGFECADPASVFSLGNLVLATPGDASGDDLKKIDVVNGGTKFTLEIGGANGASSLVADYAVNSKDILFKKVGSGILTLDGTSLDSLTVSEGAIAAGASAPTVTALTMASGSFIAASTNVTIAATTAAIDGVKVLVSDSGAFTAGTDYPLVVASSSLSGSPERLAVGADGNKVSAGNNLYWLAKKSEPGTLRLTAGKLHPGFMVIVR